MSQVRPIFKREFAGYFRTPVAYVFLIAFLVMSVALAFSRFGGFFDHGRADLDDYFGPFPWLFLFIVPSVFALLMGRRTPRSPSVYPDDPDSPHYDPEGREPEVPRLESTASHPGRPEDHP